MDLEIETGEDSLYVVKTPLTPKSPSNGGDLYWGTDYEPLNGVDAYHGPDINGGNVGSNYGADALLGVPNGSKAYAEVILSFENQLHWCGQCQLRACPQQHRGSFARQRRAQHDP